MCTVSIAQGDQGWRYLLVGGVACNSKLAQETLHAPGYTYQIYEYAASKHALSLNGGESRRQV